MTYYRKIFAFYATVFICSVLVAFSGVETSLAQSQDTLSSVPEDSLDGSTSTTSSSTYQTSVSQAPASPDFSTPYHVIYYHLVNLQQESYKPQEAARTLFAPFMSAEERESRAIMLKTFLDSRGYFVEIENLPTDPDYTDPTTGRHKYILFAEQPLIAVEKIDGRWQYSRTTVQSIPMLYESLFPFGLSEVVERIPTAQKKILGLYVWQIAVLASVVFAAFILYEILLFGLRYIVLRALYKFGKETVAEKFIIPVARQMSLLVVFLLLPIFVPLLQLPVGITRLSLNVINASSSFFGVFIVYRLVDLIAEYLNVLALRTTNTLDDQLVPLFRKAAKVTVIITGGIFILQNLDFNVTALLTGVSIGGAALAFASQDTIKNVFGSIMIFADRPFQVGDWVVVKGLEGTVEEVGFRSTRIRTFYDSVICVPNGDIAVSAVDNMGARRYRRFRTILSVTYDSKPESIEAFVEGIYTIVEEHPETRKDVMHIRLNDFGAASLDILLYIFFSVPDWKAELRVRQEIMLEILHLAESLNIRFAFPTQTLHIESMPGEESLTPPSISNRSELAQLTSTFKRDYQKRLQEKLPPPNREINFNSGGE